MAHGMSKLADIAIAVKMSITPSNAIYVLTYLEFEKIVMPKCGKPLNSGARGVRQCSTYGKHGVKHRYGGSSSRALTNVREFPCTDLLPGVYPNFL
jgi:hypothetical protein